jgi:hypothetical protein
MFQTSADLTLVDISALDLASDQLGFLLRVYRGRFVYGEWDEPDEDVGSDEL